MSQSMAKQLHLARSLYLIIFTLSWGLFGCNNLGSSSGFVSVTTTNNNTKNNFPQVVATTTILCDLVDKIASGTINLSCLIPPNTDPYTYQVNNNDRQALYQAKLIFYNGYNLEPQLIKAIINTPNRSPKVAVAKFAVKKPLYYRNQGRRIPNPHIWHNVKHATRMVAVINSFLGQRFPQNKNIYQENANALKSELFQLHKWVKTRINTIPKEQRELITAHDSMGYYAKAYGFNLSGSVHSINTTKKPTPARSQALVQGIKKAKVLTIFPEFTVETESIRNVAKQAGVKIANQKLYTHALSEPGTKADTYRKMITTNTRSIVEGLGGTYFIFTPKQKP
ncbi:MAG: zinc ABC transporter substrate-binding protein [Richelia sp.]|nr:zinc ABC transporter substrate-binding protein [Richelia sp.]